MTGKYFCFLCWLLFACLLPLNSQQSSADTRHDEWSGQLGLENEIIVLEHKYWEAWKNKDAKTLAQIRADDFREADQDGVLNKKQAEEGESDMKITNYALRNEKVSSLQPDVALLTYEVAYSGSYRGTNISSPHAFVASMYVHRDDGWRLAYSQETPAKDSDERLRKQHDASDVSKLEAAAASADDREELVSLERRAWEAAKHKDKAALARLFGEGYFDFGSDGRYDPQKVLNTGWMDDDTLEDFSWTDLQVKFLDDHTALVTYRGKYRGKESGKETSGEAYYSSLYQKQKGKWMMVFTQDSNLGCAGM